MVDQLERFCTTGQTVLVVHAHPDDEVFATGGTIAELTARGVRVVLYTASAGEAAELSVDSTISMAEARHRRSARLTESCSALGIAGWYWLGGAGRWVDTGGRPDANALTSADVGELAAEVAQVITELNPGLVLTVGDDGLTGHPDHILVHQAVIRAASDMPIPVLGAHIRRADIDVAQQLFAGLTDDPVGSGRVAGSSNEALIRLRTSVESGLARRQALDAYVNGLGSAELVQLLEHYPGRGDSLLLRGVFNVIGWNIEYYRCYSSSGRFQP